MRIGVPDSFGTADCILLEKGTGIAHIIDFKYGFQRVEVIKNTQLMLYAAGVYSEFGKQYGIKGIQAVDFPAEDCQCQYLENYGRKADVSL